MKNEMFWKYARCSACGGLIALTTLGAVNPHLHEECAADRLSQGCQPFNALARHDDLPEPSAPQRPFTMDQVTAPTSTSTAPSSGWFSMPGTSS